MRKRKGLGVAPYCLPDTSIADTVTHDEMQRELRRLRTAILILGSRSRDISSDNARDLNELLKEPSER